MTGTDIARRWAESAITGALALILLWKGGRLALFGGQWGWWLGWLMIAGGIGAALWCAAALQRARLRGRGDGPGMVSIEERRIGYYGPNGGGFVDIDELERIEALGRGGRVWFLVPEDGLPLAIPGAAAGADRLADALAALPGFSAGAAAEAMAAPGAGRITIWQRRRPALARPAPRA